MLNTSLTNSPIGALRLTHRPNLPRLGITFLPTLRLQSPSHDHPTFSAFEPELFSFRVVQSRSNMLSGPVGESM